MRSRAAAMTLAFGLVVVGMASAQESSTWLPRVFAPVTPKADPAKADKDDAPKATASVDRIALRAAKKAKADLDRRNEVCLKLRGIAVESGDDALLQKVEKLEKRAWEVYLAAKNIAAEPERPAVEADAKKGNRK
jgi:hypothetical protein